MACLHILGGSYRFSYGCRLCGYIAPILLSSRAHWYYHRFSKLQAPFHSRYYNSYYLRFRYASTNRVRVLSEAYTMENRLRTLCWRDSQISIVGDKSGKTIVIIIHTNDRTTLTLWSSLLLLFALSLPLRLLLVVLHLALVIQRLMLWPLQM